MLQEKNKTPGEPRKLDLAEAPVRTLDEVIEEIQNTTIMLATVGTPAAAVFAHDFEALVVELIHWMYEKSKTHKSPSELVFNQIAIVQQQKGKAVKLDA